MTHLLLAAAEQAADDTTVWERVIGVLVPVVLALIALFDKRVRSKVAGPQPPAADEPAAIAKTVAQTVVDGSGLQHMLVKDLQRRLDAAEVRSEKLAADLDTAQEQVADLRVTVAQLEAQIARWRAGWDRP